MEVWKEVENEIPEPTTFYCAAISNSEEKGLVIKLHDGSSNVTIDFGYVLSVNIIDEGMNQGYLYQADLSQFKQSRFRNVIYQVSDGVYSDFVKKIADGMWEAVDAKHYVIITENFNIDVITEFEPEILIEQA